MQKEEANSNENHHHVRRHRHNHHYLENCCGCGLSLEEEEDDDDRSWFRIQLKTLGSFRNLFLFCLRDKLCYALYVELSM